jgi:hypothetical protein
MRNILFVLSFSVLLLFLTWFALVLAGLTVDPLARVLTYFGVSRVAASWILPGVYSLPVRAPT